MIGYQQTGGFLCSMCENKFENPQKMKDHMESHVEESHSSFTDLRIGKMETHNEQIEGNAMMEAKEFNCLTLIFIYSPLLL